MRLSIKNTRSADFCADRIDVITNFAVITNAVIKRAHCTCIFFFKKCTQICIEFMRQTLSDLIMTFSRNLLNTRELEKIKTAVIDNGLLENHSYKVHVHCRMDGWMCCNLTPFLTVFQSYQDDGMLIMKGCVQWSSVLRF